jgi:hypothetical protein
LTIIGESSAPGSTISSAAPVWRLPTCWDGDLKTHTKRLNGSSDFQNGIIEWIYNGFQ